MHFWKAFCEDFVHFRTPGINSGGGFVPYIVVDGHGFIADASCFNNSRSRVPATTRNLVRALLWKKLTDEVRIAIDTMDESGDEFITWQTCQIVANSFSSTLPHGFRIYFLRWAPDFVPCCYSITFRVCAALLMFVLLLGHV